MTTQNKKTELKEKIKELFLSEKIKNSDIGPTRNDVFSLLTQYNVYLFDYEQVQVKERMLFLVQYLARCRHSARPIDWILVERIIDGCLEF